MKNELRKLPKCIRNMQILFSQVVRMYLGSAKFAFSSLRMTRFNCTLLYGLNLWNLYAIMRFNFTNPCHFQPFEVVDRGSETQLQVNENLN